MNLLHAKMIAEFTDHCHTPVKFLFIDHSRRLLPSHCELFLFWFDIQITNASIWAPTYDDTFENKNEITHSNSFPVGLAHHLCKITHLL
jgi:hypothetical protein